MKLPYLVVDTVVLLFIIIKEIHLGENIDSEGHMELIR